MSAEAKPTAPACEAWEGGALPMTDLLPEFFQSFFDFFRPAHTEGVAPSRIKEIARIVFETLL